MISEFDENWLPFNYFFPVQGTCGIPTGQDPESRVGDQNTGRPGRPVSSALKVPGEPGHCCARTRPSWWPSRGVFLSKCPSIAPAEMSNTPRWYFGLLDDNQWAGCCLDPPKNWGENFSSGFLQSEFFGAGWAAMPPLHSLLLLLSPGHSDIIRFRPWSTIATGSHFDRAAPKKFQKLLRRLAQFTFLIRVQAFRDPLGRELPHVQIFMNDEPNPLTWDAQRLNQ